MRTKSSVLGFLTVFLSFTYVVLATPRLGIQKDFKKDKPDIQSYSGVIRFRDFHPESNEWPPEYMGSEQLVHLAKIAYDEMVAIWRSRLLPIEQLPGAMVALATVDKILFASSIRTGINTEPPSNFHENIMKDFLETCLTEGMGTHQSGGKCGEPNVLELHYSLMGRVPIKVNEGANKKAKSAAW
ncbi:MAG: hypothetical protein M1830_002399, partial [Pleopsidium flavum]